MIPMRHKVPEPMVKEATSAIKPRSIINDRFRAITLSYHPELWQSLPAEKQNELENSPEFIAIDEKVENLSLKPKDDATTNIRGCPG